MKIRTLALIGLTLLLLASSTTASQTGTLWIDDRTIAGPRPFFSGYPARIGPDRAHAVIEVPAGSVEKWEVSVPEKDPSEYLRRDMRLLGPLDVRYLAYPVNYGMIPGTWMDPAAGGDGDPLDVLVLGPALPRGAVVSVRPVAVLDLTDLGDDDPKVLAVAAGTAFENVKDLQDLRRLFPGVTEIIETWFTHYKGPGKVRSRGFKDRQAAFERIDRAQKGPSSQKKFD